MADDFLIARLQARLRRWNVAAGTLLVAVSGGRDSMALLQGLAELVPSFRLRLIVGHLNHQLRGPASDQDEELVVQQSLRLGLECLVTRINCQAEAHSTGTNLEATARRVRYQWLATLAHEQQATWLATAHHAGDQAETVLHHLLRGSHWRGLRGIAPRRRVGADLMLLRPLLDVPRADIEAFIRNREIPFAEDATNQDCRLTRNWLRHQLLPALATRYPQLERNLCRLVARARREYAQLHRVANRLRATVTLANVDGMVVVPVKPLAGEPQDVVAEVMRQLWRRESWPSGAMTRRHWLELCRLIQAKQGAVDLPGRLHARRVRQVLQIWPSRARQ